MEHPTEVVETAAERREREIALGGAVLALQRRGYALPEIAEALELGNLEVRRLAIKAALALDVMLPPRPADQASRRSRST